MSALKSGAANLQTTKIEPIIRDALQMVWDRMYSYIGSGIRAFE